MSRWVLSISKDGDSTGLSGKPVQMLSHLHSRKVFPDVEREPPVFQFVPTASGPVTGHHWEEPGSTLFSPSLQVFIHSDKTLPTPSLLFLQVEQSQLSQLFLTGDMFQSPNRFSGPLLDCPQYVQVSCNEEPRTRHSTSGVATSATTNTFTTFKCKERLWLKNIFGGYLKKCNYIYTSGWLQGEGGKCS